MEIQMMGMCISSSVFPIAAKPSMLAGPKELTMRWSRRKPADWTTI